MDKYRVKPGRRVSLNKYDPRDTSGYDGDKDSAEDDLKQLSRRLNSLQELLYAEHKHRLLIVLQAMDTGGKDGTIRHVFQSVDPLGVRVVSFKAPTPDELDHDYLWRIHRHMPARGEIVIFNRSHYEDVLIVRVKNLVPPKIWGQRYEQINAFEHLMADEGTTILKFFLHISKDEQKERLQARLDSPDKQWKFDPNDLGERAYWRKYMQAYQDVLSKTSTAWAPWYIVPADRKWYRNLVVASTIVETLESLKMQYPAPSQDLSKIVIE